MRLNRRLVFWTVPAALVLLVLCAIAVRVGFGWYLASDSFRRKMSVEVSTVLQAEGEFMPLQITGASVYSDGFAARGGSGAFFSSLRADQVRAELNWRGVLRRAWQIDELSAQRLDIQFATAAPRARESRAAPLRALPVTSQAKHDAWKLDLRRARVQDSRWRWGSDAATAGGLQGSALTLTPAGDSCMIKAAGGKLMQSGWPELSLETAQLRYTPSSLFITESLLRNGAAQIAVSGEVRFQEAADLRAQLTRVPIGPLLPTDWRARLHGNVSGLVKIHAPLSDPALMRVEGSLQLVNGHVEALPILNQIALFTRTERFRRIALTKASGEFTREADALVARKVVLESEGLLRIEGQFTVRDEQIDGAFAVGVTAASLQWLPGAQARVFTVARDGYLWSSMRVTGPVAHPDEDLSRRLVTAAAGEILQAPEAIATEAAKTILDLFRP